MNTQEKYKKRKGKLNIYTSQTSTQLHTYKKETNKNTQHAGRQYTQNAQILTKQKTTKEKTKGQIKQRKTNKQTKNTLHNEVLRKSEKRRRGNYYL